MQRKGKKVQYGRLRKFGRFAGKQLWGGAGAFAGWISAGGSGARLGYGVGRAGYKKYFPRMRYATLRSNAPRSTGYSRVRQPRLGSNVPAWSRVRTPRTGSNRGPITGSNPDRARRPIGHSKTLGLHRFFHSKSSHNRKRFY